MPEFYEGSECNYQRRAQPYLDAIARGMRDHAALRAFMLKPTIYDDAYAGAELLWKEQWITREKKKPRIGPFWSNYPCGLDKRCSCRIPGSKSLESDAIFFLRNSFNRVLAVHVEFKRTNEPFIFGQPEGYPLRATCFLQTWQKREGMNEHHDWTTVIFCGPETLSDVRLSKFQRVITHGEASNMIAWYPTGA